MYVIVNIRKNKSMHGLNYLSFCEQRFFLNYADIACLVSFLMRREGRGGEREREREREREGVETVFSKFILHHQG